MLKICLKNWKFVFRKNRLIGFYDASKFEKLPFDDWPSFSEEYLKNWVQSLLRENCYLRYVLSKKNLKNE